MIVRPPLVRRAAALLVGVAAVSGCGGDDTADGRLPEVTVVELGTGTELDLAAVEGPAVVNLWATTCAPCVREIPAFEEVHRARGDEVRFLGVNIGEDADRASDFLADLDVTYEQYLDELGYVVSALETSAMPVTIVTDADGAIVTEHLGAMDAADLDRAIDEALAAG